MVLYTSYLLTLLLAAAVAAQDRSCTCKPKVRCSWALYGNFDTSGLVCDLGQGREGFCCPDLVRRITSTTRTSSLKPPTSTISTFLSSSSSILPNLNSKKVSQTSRVPRRLLEDVDFETRGHRLFTKPKKEFQDLRDYANWLLHQG